MKPETFLERLNRTWSAAKKHPELNSDLREFLQVLVDEANGPSAMATASSEDDLSDAEKELSSLIE